MSNPSKAKGDAAERAVRDSLRAAGIACARIPAGTTLDTGDLFIAGGAYVADVKAVREMRLGTWCDRLAEQIVNAEAATGAVIVRRLGSPDPLTWFAVRSLRDEIAHIRAVSDGCLGRPCPHREIEIPLPKPTRRQTDETENDLQSHSGLLDPRWPWNREEAGPETAA